MVFLTSSKKNPVALEQSMKAGMVGSEVREILDFCYSRIEGNGQGHGCYSGI